QGNCFAGAAERREGGKGIQKGRLAALSAHDLALRALHVAAFAVSRFSPVPPGSSSLRANSSNEKGRSEERPFCS
ncbi:hypothetical protein, partial [Streptococcus pneumoniae]|uniref:hypothetical protein n=1 Tax=Streptococcus pneumoniae TaxID=1313 RepID=UPI001954BBD6